jgi:hypothetical protein
VQCHYNDYFLDVETENHKGVFDVKPYMKSDFFNELKEESYFKNIFINKYSIEWKNGQDFSVDTIIYDLKNKVRIIELKTANINKIISV